MSDATTTRTITISDVQTFCTAPEGTRLVVVKVLTSEPGLEGLGCATFTQRPLAVVTAIEEYLKPFVVGRDVDEIEDIWQAAYVSSYWRSGPVLNNALAGIDLALWDIKGKRAGMPVYQLLGGKCRPAAPVYVHASGRDFREVEDRIRPFQERGHRHFRVDAAIPSRSGPGSRRERVWEPAAYVRNVVGLIEHLRVALGPEVELMHDVHERLPPVLAINLAKELEKYNLFFLEDPLAPEDQDYLRLLRQQTATPIALGELYVNPSEYVPVIRDRLIDFIRVHLSFVGGLSVGRKIAALSEFFGVRTAWHGPWDISGPGVAANLALDLAVHNFGIQEFVAQISEKTRAVFPGYPELRDGMLWPNERPGLGIEFDEKLAATFPYPDHPLNGGWAPIRLYDGTVIRP